VALGIPELADQRERKDHRPKITAVHPPILTPSHAVEFQSHDVRPAQEKASSAARP
jgi:hypothetical protein